MSTRQTSTDRRTFEISRATAFALESLVSSWIFSLECGAFLFLITAPNHSALWKFMVIAVLVSMGLIIDDRRRARQPTLRDFNEDKDWIWYMTAHGVSAVSLNYVVWHHGPSLLALASTSLLVFCVTRHLLRHHQG